MTNKEKLKKTINKDFDKTTNYNELIKKLEVKKISIWKMSLVPICLLVILGSLLLIKLQNVEQDFSNHNTNYIYEESNKTIIKVYTYTMSKSNKLEKQELKDNVKLGLARYNLAMSSVPGYPIEFELVGIESIKIDVTDGNIFNWDKETGKVKSLGSTYELSNNGALYFNVNENTNIRIRGIKEKKEVFEKNITISSYDNFNYYAVME